ncbi:hypothetical protein ACHAXT_003189 [Thalassiosira profunda]
MSSSLPIRASPLRAPRSSQRRDAAVSKAVLVAVKISFVLMCCGSSYLAGSLFGHQSLDSTLVHAPMSVGRLMHGDSLPASASRDCAEAERKLVEAKVKEELQKQQGSAIRKAEPTNKANTASESPRFPKTTGKFANGMGRIKKDDLVQFFDFGNPMEPGRGGKEDAIIIYQHKNALPSSDESLAHAAQYNDRNGLPLMDPKTATENCDALNVIFTDNPGSTRQCTAVIGNFESYHIQRWMRVDTVKSTPIKPELPLAMVSRGYASRGKANFYAPPSDGKFSPVKRHWKMLLTFLQHVDGVLDDLKPILEKIARNNAVIVLTCNLGQSALLVNFICSARRRGFDLSNVLLFPTDLETKELAEGLGLTTYYDAMNMGPLPSGEAKRYGDKNFKAMMYAKVLCVLYPLMLGYDVLFQDVDIVWIRDPMQYFHDDSKSSNNFDVIFQHDGSYSVRYAPYTANSGFYYARANKRTQYLFTSMLYHADLIITWDSHQQLLVQLLAEHSSLFGLQVQVLGRDTEMFPGGYHFHQRRDFMKKLMRRETETYIFHMSWTENKTNKLLFLRQLGEWYVNEKCVGKTARDILGGSPSSVGDALFRPCCAAEPIFSCHFRDKPSKLPCLKSDPIDKNGRSFW